MSTFHGDALDMGVYGKASRFPVPSLPSIPICIVHQRLHLRQMRMSEDSISFARSFLVHKRHGGILVTAVATMDWCWELSKQSQLPLHVKCSQSSWDIGVSKGRQWAASGHTPVFWAARHFLKWLCESFRSLHWVWGWHEAAAASCSWVIICSDGADSRDGVMGGFPQ